MYEPRDEAELAEIVVGAAGGGSKLVIEGGATKTDVGRSVSADRLSMRAMRGVIDYDPSELVLTVRPGTPLAEIEELIAGERQMLAFEPYDFGPVMGTAAGASTIGGVVAAGVSGSRRISAGAARDHLLGLRAVSGRGEIFVAGAKVVKNVTGYDIPKLAAGSWGRLFALSELTLKVLPRPEVVLTRMVEGLDLARALPLMAAVMGSKADVAAIAHIPGRDARASRTAIRIEGFGPSVAARSQILDGLFDAGLEVATLGAAVGERFWADIRNLAHLPAERPTWRINISPRAAGPLMTSLEAAGAQWQADWAGGLIWAAGGDAPTVREAAGRAGGHATLIRATAEMRAAVATFHPQPPGLAALEERVRRAFDPMRIFDTGRF